MAKNPAKLINGALDFIGGLSSETISKHKGLTKLMNKVEKSSSELSSYNFSNACSPSRMRATWSNHDRSNNIKNRLKF